MLRTISPNISIITNWGCPEECWYCIWKKHPLKNVCLKTDWNKLTKFLVDNKNKGKVSVSGGGDCLYRYSAHKIWWNRLFNITKKLNMKIDVHSRTKFYNDNFWSKINKCVVSSDIIDDLKNYPAYLNQFTTVRIVKVITDETNSANVRKYIKYANKIGCQLTFKQLTGFDDNGNYKKYKKMFSNQFFLDEGDYNIYFFPNNTIQTNFI